MDDRLVASDGVHFGISPTFLSLGGCVICDDWDSQLGFVVGGRLNGPLAWTGGRPASSSDSYLFNCFQGCKE